MIDYDDTKDLEQIAKEEQLHLLHKRCWTSGSLNSRAVGDYVKYVLDNVCESWIKAEDIFYARVYIGFFERQKYRLRKSGRKDA